MQKQKKMSHKIGTKVNVDSVHEDAVAPLFLYAFFQKKECS